MRATAFRLKKWLPWVVGIAVLGYLFRRVPLREAFDAARDANFAALLGAALVGVVAWWALESSAFAYLFSRFNAPLSRREARSLRAVTYLLTPINWNLGTASIVLHLRRSKGIAALAATSSLLFYGLIDGLVLGGLTLVGVQTLPPSPMVETIAGVARWFVGVQLVLLAFFLLPLPSWSWRRRVRSLGVFRTHSLAGGRDVAVLIAIRGLYFVGFILFFWAGTRAFAVDVPLSHLAAVVPAILLVSGLPITPAGLGTTQAAMLYFLGPFGSEAQILAYGLCYPVVLVAARMPLGLLYVRDLALLRAPIPEAGERQPSLPRAS